MQFRCINVNFESHHLQPPARPEEALHNLPISSRKEREISFLISPVGGMASKPLRMSRCCHGTSGACILLCRC